MPDESADDLLDKLSRGEVEAAGELFATYAPYLRALVRRQISDRLRTKFDSADVVQSVWVQVVRQLGQDGWTVEDETRLRALLAIIARRRLLTRVRRFTGDPTGEGIPEADAPDHSPRPSEVVQADDLWERMLALCPPDHHSILHLRREGLQLQKSRARACMRERARISAGWLENWPSKKNLCPSRRFHMSALLEPVPLLGLSSIRDRPRRYSTTSSPISSNAGETAKDLSWKSISITSRAFGMSPKRPSN